MEEVHRILDLIGRHHKIYYPATQIHLFYISAIHCIIPHFGLEKKERLTCIIIDLRRRPLYSDEQKERDVDVRIFFSLSHTST